MNRQQITEQLRAQSQVAFTQAKIKKLHEAAANVGVTNTSAAGGSGGGGGRMPVTGLSFVVNTTDYPEFGFDFTSTNEPIEFTINWGDGTIHEDSGYGGYYEESHDYGEERLDEYTVTITFDDPLKILEIDFPGFNDDYAGISSITGLQSLSNLEEFRADYNYLVSVDLSGLTNLTYVDISDCEIPNTEGEHSLTTVNLSGCTALEELRLDDSDFSNGIPDLSGLTALRRLDFDQCGIKGTVDLSGLTSLESFDLYGNDELTRVIISSSQPLGEDNDYDGVEIYSCALTQTAVNNILIALAANDIENGRVNLAGDYDGSTGGSNAAPGAPGLAAITTLEGRGWDVYVNS
jgi:hypothetical protein